MYLLRSLNGWRQAEVAQSTGYELSNNQTLPNPEPKAGLVVGRRNVVVTSDGYPGV
jgi:hypothetical protein